MTHLVLHCTNMIRNNDNFLVHSTNSLVINIILVVHSTILMGNNDNFLVHCTNMMGNYGIFGCSF